MAPTPIELSLLLCFHLFHSVSVIYFTLLGQSRPQGARERTTILSRKGDRTGLPGPDDFASRSSEADFATTVARRPYGPGRSAPRRRLPPPSATGGPKLMFGVSSVLGPCGPGPG